MYINAKKTKAVFLTLWRCLHVLTSKHILLYRNNFAACLELKYPNEKKEAYFAKLAIYLLELED